MYSTLGMADSDDGNVASRSRGRQPLQEDASTVGSVSAEEQAGTQRAEDTTRRRTAENGHVTGDRDAGFTEEWAQQLDERSVRRRDQVCINTKLDVLVDWH